MSTRADERDPAAVIWRERHEALLADYCERFAADRDLLRYALQMIKNRQGGVAWPPFEAETITLIQERLALEPPMP